VPAKSGARHKRTNLNRGVASGVGAIKSRGKWGGGGGRDCKRGGGGGRARGGGVGEAGWATRGSQTLSAQKGSNARQNGILRIAKKSMKEKHVQGGGGGGEKFGDHHSG